MRAYRQLAARADVVIVEGVGRVARAVERTRATRRDLARRLRLPVVLVVGMRLGCLSHALLTAEAIAARGLALAGWIANRIDPRMRAYRGNVEALRARLGAPLLGEVAFVHSSARAASRSIARSQRAASSQRCA